MSDGPLPVAGARPVRARSLAWFWPLLAIGLASWIGGRAWRERGPELLLRTSHGHGLGPGDLLLYRGIAVGEVHAVELRSDLADVELRVRLEPDAEPLARVGSRFWIVRPDVGFDRLRGLETILGARHVAVLPGPADGPVQREFICLEEEPVLTAGEAGDVEFFLEAPRRFGLAPGAPITYRQIEVGKVLAVGLASDATGVEIRACVRRPYAELVREDTRFWETGGMEFSLDLLGGLRVDLDSLRSLLVGGVALATPDQPGARVRTGHRFRLEAEPEEDWLAWSPGLALGTTGLPADTPRLEPLRARLVWESGMFGLDRSATGWLIALEAGLVGPVEILRAPDGADGPALELRGERLTLEGPADREHGGLALRDLGRPGPRPWPAERVRALGDPEDVVVQLDASRELLALSSGRLHPSEEGWEVDPAVPIDADWHGAGVLARADGYLLGVLLVDGERASVRPLAPLLAD